MSAGRGPLSRPGSIRRGLAISLVALAALLSACGGEPAERTTDSTATAVRAAAVEANVLLVTVDTLRPDALGWVSGTDLTPNLDALARGGFRFPRAVAPVPLTHPSHSAMMTGVLPRRLGVRDNGQVLGAGVETLAEVLRERGWATAAAVSGYPLAAEFGLDQGFDHYDDELTAGEGAWLERPAPATTAAALAWLETAPEPWFLWVHYYDPHLPYEPPPELERPGWRGAYDGEVALVDRAVGELLGDVEARARAPLLSVFTADHGESLGEHGEGSHGFFIYDSTVLVPLVFRFPGRVESGESEAGARLVDLAPTVLDLLGLPLPEGADGVSLAPLLRGDEVEIPPAYVETLQPWTSYGWAPLRAVRHDGWKLIAAPRPELYRLEIDPGEERDLLAEEREKARELRRHLDRIEALPPAAAEAVSDPEALERLRALGYLGAGAPATDEPPPGLPDPKDRGELRELLTAGDELLRRGDVAAALERFERVLAVEPENRFALSRSGLAWLRRGEPARARAPLAAAVDLSPRDPEVRAALAQTLTATGELEPALEHWMELVNLQPRRASAWSNLGATLGRLGRAEEAVSALERAVELEPGNADRQIRLAFAQHAAGDLEAAASTLEAAARRLDRFPHPGALGLILLQLGRPDEARPWLEKSRPGEGDYVQARLELVALDLAAGRRDAARRHLQELLAHHPELRSRLAADPRLAPLLRPPDKEHK